MNSLSIENKRVKHEIRIVGGADGRFVTHEGHNVQPCGGQAYPFLLGFDTWEIRTRSVQAPELSVTDIYPSLRMVREGKVADILIPTEQRVKRLADIPGLYGECFTFGLPTAEFLAYVGLDVSLERGAAVVSKRLARLFSPYRFWSFYQDDAVNIVHSERLDPMLWDGCGLMSRAFFERCQSHMLVNVPEEAHERYRRELEKTKRVEITLMHAAGQEKGDVLIVDEMPPFADAADFLFPVGSTKMEVLFTKGTFVGFKQTRKAKTYMRLDIQSLINHHQFFGNDRLLHWLEEDSQSFLASIQTGERDYLLQRLLGMDSADSLAKLRDWWLGDYFISGGKAMWFGGIVQALGRQRLRVLEMQTQGKHRFPIPGLRLYIMPAAVGGCDVARGEVKIDLARASAFVNDDDWLDYIVSVLGGCDGDDAVWCFPFTDSVDEIDAITGEVSQARKLLIWRSPNQAGEWITLRPTTDSDVIESDWPLLDSTKLSPRIDTVTDIAFGSLPVPERVHRPTELVVQTLPQLRRMAKRLGLRGYSKLRKGEVIAQIVRAENGYTVAKMTPAIAQAQQNVGVLGTYVNVLMVCKAIFGRIPRSLPAPLEDVIDGSVKDGRDLTAVKLWCEQAVSQLVRQQHPVPHALVKRVERLATASLTLADSHWLDTLLDAAREHLDEVQQAIDALTLQCCPPRTLFKIGADWQEQAVSVHTAYSRIIGIAVSQQTLNGKSYRTAFEATMSALACWPEHEPELLAGLASLVYMGGLLSPSSDDVLWQMTADSDVVDMPKRFLNALRQFGVLGEPVWADTGAVLYWQDEATSTALMPLSINGVWFNYARCHNPSYVTMHDVPKPVANAFKRKLMKMAPRMIGRTLHVQTMDERIVMRTEHNNLFGYVKRGQGHLLKGVACVVIHYLTVTEDGNIQAVVEPNDE